MQEPTMMKRMDAGKVSLVEFLSSIKFRGRNASIRSEGSGESFARLDQRAPVSQPVGKDESVHVRSAN